MAKWEVKRAEEKARQEAERLEQERLRREEAERKAEEEARQKAELERLKQEQAEAADGEQGQEEGGDGAEGEAEAGEEGKDDEDDKAEAEEAEAVSQGDTPELKVTDSDELHPSEEDLSAAPEEDPRESDFPPDLPETEEFKAQRASFERDFQALVSIIKGTNNLEPIFIGVDKEGEALGMEVIKKVEGTRRTPFRSLLFFFFCVSLRTMFVLPYAAHPGGRSYRTRVDISNSSPGAFPLPSMVKRYRTPSKLKVGSSWGVRFGPGISFPRDTPNRSLLLSEELFVVARRNDFYACLTANRRKRVYLHVYVWTSAYTGSSPVGCAHTSRELH